MKAGEKYQGWRCSKCRAGNKLGRKRCKQCGRQRLGSEEVTEFTQRPHVLKKKAVVKASKTVIHSKNGRITGFEISGPAADAFFRGMTGAPPKEPEKPKDQDKKEDAHG